MVMRTLGDRAGGRIVAATLFFAALYAGFFTGLSRSIAVTVLFRDFYLPLFGWSAIAFFAAAWAKVFGDDIRDLLPRAVLTGIFLHLSALLAGLNAQLSAGSPLSGVYLVYIRGISCVMLAALFCASFTVLHKVFVLRDGGICIMLPLPLACPAVAAAYLRAAPALVAPALCAGAALFYAVTFRPEACAAVLRRVRSALSDDRIIAGLLFLAAFALRAAFSVQILRLTGGGATFVDASDDGRSYDPMGWTLASVPGALFAHGKVFPDIWDPGYVLFLSAVYRIFGHSFPALTIVQSALNALLPVIMYFFASRLFTRRIALIAGILACLDQALIMYSVVIGTEALFMTTLALTMLFFARYLDGALDRRAALLAGFALGVSVITRSMLIALPLFLFPALVYASRETLRKKAAGMALICLAMLGAILPVTAINYANTGAFHLIARSNERLTICWGSTLVGREKESPSNVRFIAMGIEPFRDPAGSLRAICAHPARFAGIGIAVWSARLRNFFLWPNFGYVDPLVLVNPSKLANPFGSTMELYICIVSLAGVWRSLRLMPRRRVIVTAFIIGVYFICVHIFLYRVNSVRYRLAAIPYLLVFLAVGADAMYAWFRREGRIR